MRLLRGKRQVARADATRPGSQTIRLAFRPPARGVYRVRIVVESAGERVVSTLTARKL